MKKYFSMVFMCLLTTVIFFVGNALSLPLPFYDGFENIPVGDYPSANGWQNLTDGADAYVSDDVAYGGDHSLKIISEPHWARVDIVQLDTVPDILSYGGAIYIDPNYVRSARLGFFKRVGGQVPNFNNFSIINWDGSAGEVYFTGSPDVPMISLGDFTIGNWVFLRADLDFITQTADLWVNGNLVETNFPIYPKEFDDPEWGHVVMNQYGAMEYNWPGDGTGVIYIDDVFIGETAPVPELPVCSSTVVTISDLKIEVENLETSSKTIKVLSRTLDNAQQALDKGNNKIARSWMGNFISKVVKRSNFKEGNLNRIALDEANSLLCGAANVLIGIELP